MLQLLQCMALCMLLYAPVRLVQDRIMLQALHRLTAKYSNTSPLRQHFHLCKCAIQIDHQLPLTDAQGQCLTTRGCFENQGCPVKQATNRQVSLYLYSRKPGHYTGMQLPFRNGTDGHDRADCLPTLNNSAMCRHRVKHCRYV